jgi:PAS domain S-box-containing protein
MGSEEQLRREIAELRAREQRQLELSKRLREYAAHLRTSLRDQPLRGAGPVFEEVAAVSAEALDVARVSVWLFDAGRRVLECKHLYERGVGARVTGEMQISEVEGYVRAVTTDLLAVEDVTTDPRLSELHRYCAEREIGALLDVPIVVDTEALGVLCHEHVGGTRSWHDAEIDFASNLGSIVALAIEAERRHEAQDRARDAFARYLHLLETLPVVIYSIDVPTGHLTYISPTIEALTGRSAEGWLSAGMDGWIAAILDEDRPLVRERLRGSPGGTVEPELIYRMRRGDGGVIWLRDLRTVVRGPAGEPLAVQGTLEDITAERSAEQRRVEAERRYRQLIDHLDLIGVVLDTRGAIVAVNAEFTRTVGVPRWASIGAAFVERFVPEDERARVWQLFADGIRTRALPPRFECSLLAADGALRRVVWTTTLQHDDAGEVIGTASVGLDLTERLRLEAELAQQRKFESLGRMAAGVAHDFNNVLTVISLSLSHGAKDDEITAAMGYARELVASLLAYARREPVAVADVDVDAAIGELVPVLATAIGKGLHLDVGLRAGRRVRIAPTELHQLVVNLVTNAGEATRGHGHTVRVTTDAIASEAPRAGGAPGPCVELRIADDGRGMDEATRARAFDPFFTTKPPGEGTGIGLATCHSIVSRAGGSITIDGKPGAGTAFRILLPAAAVAEAPAPEAPAGGPVTGQRVLLVEDSATIGGLMSGVLRDAGYRVMLVATVAGALEALEGEPFSIVITDLQMPDGRGEAIVEAARARSAQTAIVVASGEATVMNGVDAVVRKPFSPDELKAGIGRAARHRREAQ